MQDKLVLPRLMVGRVNEGENNLVLPRPMVGRAYEGLYCIIFLQSVTCIIFLQVHVIFGLLWHAFTLTIACDFWKLMPCYCHFTSFILY